MTRRFASRADGERGATLVFTVLVMSTMLAAAALVIDLGQLRTRTQLDQATADFAALAAAQDLSASDPASACSAAVKSINTNLDISIAPSTFCSQSGNNVAQTTCSTGGTLTQAAPSATSGRYTVSIHYPVPNTEIADSAISGGARLYDGLPCQRMRVIVSATDDRLFSRVLGSGSLQTTRAATVRPAAGQSTTTPALWLLDPTGCVGLSVSGGSQVTVGTTTNPGVIVLDSDGSTCQSNQNTVSASGTGTFLKAVPTTSSSTAPGGAIKLVALPIGTSTCVAPACSTSDVADGRIAPQPIRASSRATRSHVDHRFNCKGSYPLFHGITIRGCTAGTPSHIDNLKTGIGTSGNPGGYLKWSDYHNCNPNGTITESGNWWVDCSSGLSIGNGTNVTFSGGNVVLDGGLKMTGGTATFNTTVNTNSLPSSCLTTVCIGSSSPSAAFVYIRAGNLDLTGGTVNFNKAMVYQASGYVKIAGSASPPTWTAPTEGPFRGLALWSELSSSQFTINGGGGIQLTGVFFTPEAAPFTLTGGGNWGQQQAQFISYQLQVSGGSVLTMAPDPSNAVQTPIETGMLIR